MQIYGQHMLKYGGQCIRYIFDLRSETHFKGTYFFLKASGVWTIKLQGLHALYALKWRIRFKNVTPLQWSRLS